MGTGEIALEALGNRGEDCRRSSAMGWGIVPEQLDKGGEMAVIVGRGGGRGVGIDVVGEIFVEERKSFRGRDEEAASNW